ncbi:MAG TPA: hypothetical protein PLQ65_12940, partial [Flavihumibacter sp.]|nr:hypothetical protein [Flavihumibacter sp.]
GDVVKVKLTGTDPKSGKFKLSRKILLPKPEGMPADGERAERGERPDRPPRFNDRGERPQRKED